MSRLLRTANPAAVPVLTATVLRCFFLGVLGGLVDAGLGLTEAARFLTTPGSWLAWTTLALFLHGLAAALLGLGLGLALILFLRWTLPGQALLRQAPDRPAPWGSATAHALVFSLWGLLSMAVVAALAALFFARFNHKGLTAALTGLAALAVPLALALPALLVARLGTGPLRRLDRAPGPWPRLAFLGAALLPPLLATTLAAWLQWETVSNLPLRKLLLLAALGASCAASLLFPSRHLARLRPLPVLLALLLLFGALQGLSTAERPRKAAEAALSSARDLMGSARRVWDLDRDGYSPLFGGQDCNDLSSTIHPGAFDWPDDSQDQNCLGGDATVRDRQPFPSFPVPPTVPKQLNVVYITVDALAASHLGCYGYHRDTSPRIDAFAKGAILFEKSFAHAPSTRYSFPAMMTARYPASVAWGDGSWPPPVLPENLTFAEALRDLGYYTGALLNYRFFKEEWGLNQGFDLYDNSRSRLHQGKSDPATHGSSSKEMADASIDFLQANADRPFFLWVHFYDPHWFYEEHPGFSVFGKSREDLYDGEIRFTDHHIGRLLDALEAQGLADNTLVILTGDHGEGFGEHGIELHGYHLYNPQTFVPIILRVPGLPPRRVTQEVATHVDLIPTVLNVLGAPIPPDFQGGSLLDVMTGDSTYRRRRFQEVWYADRGPFTRMVSVVDSQWKLIFNEQPSGTFELYDLQLDPGETTDLWGQTDPALEQELRDLVVRHMEEDHLPLDFHTRIAPNISDQPFADNPGNQGALLGEDSPLVELQGSLLERLPSPDQGLRITVWWKVLKTPGPRWKLFTHVKPASGKFINADHEPVGGFYPVSSWQAGQYIRDIQELRLSKAEAARAHSVVAGLYSGNQRLKILSLGKAQAALGGGLVLGSLPKQSGPAAPGRRP